MIYNTVLVPLDGSPLAECSLEQMKTIAIGCHVPRVILLRVVEPLSSLEINAMVEAGSNAIETLETAKESEAKNYINEMANKLRQDGIPVQGDIIDGNATEAILNYAENNNADLIIMSTHGRSGISRWFFGSVAERVVYHSRIPVLINTPRGCRLSR